MLTGFLFKIKDHRRKQGVRYESGHILFFSVSAILSGADSYRKVQKFIVNHYNTFNKMFKPDWKGMPAHTTVRDIIKGTSGSALEKSFRQYSAILAENDNRNRLISCDGKVLRGGFDHFKDLKAVLIQSAFLSDSHIIPAHEEIATKTDEIPTAQCLIEALGLTGYIFTFDALHCQEKTLRIA